MTCLTPIPRADIAELPITSGAQWLTPSAWPSNADAWFRPGPPDISVRPVLITRYADVIATMRTPAAWRRKIPESVVPRPRRHDALDAAWMVDGPEHKLLRGTLTPVNRGSTPKSPARAAACQLTRQLLGRLMAQKPPWNLSQVIYPVSMQIILAHTLAAPPLLPHARRLQERVRAVDASSGGFDGIAADPEFEELLLTVADPGEDLPDGLARDLVRAHRDGRLTRRQLAAQLALVVISYETQATAAANLIAMILEGGYRDWAARALDNPELTGRLVAEGGRRGLTFPVNVQFADEPVTIGGVTIPAGTQALICYGAANMDTEVYGEDAVRFDPRPVREARHLAFGIGAHRCLGAPPADQFTEDVTRAMLGPGGLPPGACLAGDRKVLREVGGLVWSIADLPVTRPGREHI
jgi:cytochrome P450